MIGQVPPREVGPVVGQQGARTAQFDRWWINWFKQAYRLLFSIQQSGTTTQRPTEDLWVGRQYFDTTLNVQVWYDGTTWVVPSSSSGVIGASYVVLSADPTLTDERVLTAGTNITLTDSGAGGTITIDASSKSVYFKDAVRFATTGDVTLAGGAPDSVDQATGSPKVVVGDRILVKSQTTTTQNGIYVVQTVGTGSNGTWVRATDADTSAELPSGLEVRVTEGDNYAGSVWYLRTADPIVLGTTGLLFDRGHGGSGGAGNVAVGQLALDGSNSGLSVANTAVGYFTLSSGLALGNDNNTAVGNSALAVCQSQDNTAVGSGAGFNLTTARRASILGKQAGLTLTTGNDNTILGALADVDFASASRRTVISKGAVGKFDNSVQLGIAGDSTIAGAGALNTTDTFGFLYIPTCAGTPTGTPTTVTGMAPLIVDSSANKLYFYSGGAWRDAGP